MKIKDPKEGKSISSPPLIKWDILPALYRLPGSIYDLQPIEKKNTILIRLKLENIWNSLSVLFVYRVLRKFEDIV